MAKATQQMVNLADYVSVSQAAVEIGCTPGRVRQLVYDDQINALRLTPRMMLVKRSDVAKVAKTPAKTGRPRSRAAS